MQPWSASLPPAYPVLMPWHPGDLERRDKKAQPPYCKSDGQAMISSKTKPDSQNLKPATSRESEVRMLTPSEIESLQRDKAETVAWMLRAMQTGEHRVSQTAKYHQQSSPTDLNRDPSGQS